MEMGTQICENENGNDGLGGHTNNEMPPTVSTYNSSDPSICDYVTMGMEMATF